MPIDLNTLGGLIDRKKSKKEYYDIYKNSLKRKRRADFAVRPCVHLPLMSRGVLHAHFQGWTPFSTSTLMHRAHKNVAIDNV